MLTPTIDTFRSIVDACETLRPDCESWQEAAERACENHGITFGYDDPMGWKAYDIVIDCASADLPMTDVGFWAGDFADAVNGDA
jgi:hypothetical protein